MKSLNIRWFSIFLVNLLCLDGCGLSGNTGEGDNNGMGGSKGDNYYSNVAQEYQATTQGELTLDEVYLTQSQADRSSAAQALLEGKTKQIAWFLNLYLIDKAAVNYPGGSYGNMHGAVIHEGAFSQMLQGDPQNLLKFAYTFSVHVGGSQDMLNKIRTENQLEENTDTFPLQMQKLSNEQLSDFQVTKYVEGMWSPATCQCDIETLPITLKPVASSPDAYLDYGKMLQDGVMDIAIHCGFDFRRRFDLEESRELYRWLTQDMGFSSPTKTFEEYNRLAKPLTKQVKVNDQWITMQISMFHPDPCEAWDEDGECPNTPQSGTKGGWECGIYKSMLDGVTEACSMALPDKNDGRNQACQLTEEIKKTGTLPSFKTLLPDLQLFILQKQQAAMNRICTDWKWNNPEANANPTTDRGGDHMKQDLIQSLKQRDVVIYDGHADSSNAYMLSSDKRTRAGFLTPAEIKTMEFTEGKSQLFVFNSCSAYHVAEAFKANPYKRGLVNADIINAIGVGSSLSLADITKSIIQALVGDSKGDYRAFSYYELINNINSTAECERCDFQKKNGYFALYGVHGLEDNPVANPLQK